MVRHDRRAVKGVVLVFVLCPPCVEDSGRCLGVSEVCSSGISAERNEIPCMRYGDTTDP